MPKGEFTWALVAEPPSPENPDVPLPATVLISPAAAGATGVGLGVRAGVKTIGMAVGGTGVGVIVGVDGTGVGV